MIMIDLKRLRGEYTMLSYLVTDAKRACDVLTRAAVTGEAFTDAACRAAFLALMRTDAADEATRLAILRHEIPSFTDGDIEAFGGLSACSGNLEYEVIEFAKGAIKRENFAALNQLLQCGAGQQPELLIDGQKRIAAEMQTKLDALNAAFNIVPSENGNEAAADGPQVLDEGLLHVPGFIDELVAYTMRYAPRPNRTLSLVGALAMLAHLAGRRFIGPNDARPNIYLVALAGSGAGKEAPRTVNRNLAQLESMEVSMKGDIVSGQGLEDALLRTPTLLMQVDEFDALLNVLKDKRSNKQTSEALWSKMLSMFTSSNTNYPTRVKAAGSNGDGGGAVIYNPSLSMMATAIPANFYGALCERALDNGFLARCLVFEAGRRGDKNPNSGSTANPIPDSIKNAVQRMTRVGRRFSDNQPVEMRDLVSVPFAEDGAAEESQRIVDDADALYDNAEKANDDMAKSVWNRSHELSMKLALLYAISERIDDPKSAAISRTALNWAWRIVKSLQLRMLDMVRRHTAETESEADVKRALNIISKAGRKGITRAEFSKKMKRSQKTMDEAVVTLVERDEIIEESLPSGRNGKPTKRYVVRKAK